MSFIVKKIDNGIKKYISELNLNHQTPGFCLIIKKNNKTIYKKSIGKGAIYSTLPKNSISPDSRFLCASLTKPVIFKFFSDLKKKKPNLTKMSLDKFFPKTKNPNIKKIKVQHLLAHKSGLSEYFGSSTALPYHQLDIYDLKKISKYILNQKLSFNPGEKTEYSNSSFVILSRIIELLFKNKYESVFDKYFKSLGPFKNTSFFTNSKKPVSNQYIKMDKKYIKAPWRRSFIGWGDGALISSPAEYLNLINPLKDKEILKGLFKIKSGPFNLCYQHNGKSVGMSNLYFFIPEKNIQAVCFQNFTNSFDNMTLPQDIFQFLSGKKTNYI